MAGELWSKNWIIGRWMALVFLGFFLLLVDVHCFLLLREYNPEDTVYGLFVMGLGNLVGFGFLGTQAQELIQDAKSAYNVPSIRTDLIEDSGADWTRIKNFSLALDP